MSSKKSLFAPNSVVMLVVLCCLIATSVCFAGLQGSYLVGPNGRFATLKAAVDTLQIQGIDGPVKFKIEQGTYEGPLTLQDYPRQGEFNVTFVVGESDLATLTATDTTAPVFSLDGVGNILVQGLKIVSNASTQPALRITNGAQDVSIFLCELTGRGSGVVAEVLGSHTSNIEISNSQIRRGGDGVVLTAGGESAQNNRVVNCVIDSVQRAISITRQTNCLIESCTLKPNSGTGNGASAVNIGAQNPGDSVLVLGNTISEVRAGNGYAVALRHAPQVSSARLVAANNFIYGFQNTGSSQIRALFLSAGDNLIANNSVLVNDVTATGTSYVIYNGLTAADSRLTLQNNILVNLEATRTAYNLFVLTTAGILNSNHNIFYGTGTSYQHGWLIGSYPTLASWQNGTGSDLASKFGDPLFTSNTDLHLQPTAVLAHQNGAVVEGVVKDIDGIIRFQPPDIGADEFAYAAPPFDAAILDVLDLPSGLPEFTLITVHVVVQNRGALPLAGLPLQLSFNDSIRAEALVSLAPSTSDTISIVWSTGAAQSGGVVELNTVLEQDAFPEDNSRYLSLTITDQPLAGIFRVGGIGSDYPTLSAALAELEMRGVSGAVAFELEAGTYTESILLGSIPGLSSSNTVTIRPSSTTEGLVQFAPTGASPAFHLSAVSHITLEGLIIRGDALMTELLRIENGSSFNVVRSCRFIGSSIDQTASSAISILGGGCNDNLLEDCELSGSFTGLRVEGSSLSRDFRNHIRGCRIGEVHTGLYTAWQHNLQVEDCDLRPGFSGAPSLIHAVRIGPQVAGDTVTISGCRISGHELASGTLIGLSNESNSGTLVAVNNWIGDFASATIAEITAINCLSGETVLWHNSVEIGESSPSSQAIAVSVIGPQANLLMRNNIFRVHRPDGQAKMIEWNAGAIDADYNLYETPGTNPLFRFAATALDEDFQTLASWTAATSQDSNSVSTSAGFIGNNDLHIRPDAAGPSDRGVALPQVLTDIDGESRGSSPDLGADEYSYIPAIIDVVVEELEIPLLPLTTATTYSLYGVIHNVGQLAAPGVVVELLYNGVVVEARSISLTINDYQELYWNWTAPSTELAFGTLTVRATASNDLVSANNSESRAIVVAGTPLSGVVTVGGTSPTFGTFVELAEQLKWRGISAPLNVRIAPGFYPYALELDPIPGASSANRVVIEPEVPGSVSLSANNSAATVHFKGTAYVELRDLNIVCGPATNTAVLFDPGSCFNLLENCTIVGSGATQIASTVVKIGGAGCIANVISGCAISSAYVGVALTGDDYNLSQDNVVLDNLISDVYYGVWVDHQVNAEVHGNDIRPGSLTGPANACYGVYVVQLGTGGSLRIEANKLHDFLDSPGPRSNRAAGVYSAAGGNSYVEILNNFIYGFEALTTLRSRAIYLSSGTHLVANNSIRLDDAPADNDVAGIFISTGMEHQLYNNCVLSYENDVPVYALDIESGADMISDYNCWWGNSASFAIAQLGTTNYATLVSWQATGQDAHGISAHADYRAADDLHLELTDSTLFEAGISLPEVTHDIDGDLRPNLPCIGADEYTPMNTLGAPSLLTIVPTGSSRVTLRWQAAPGASLYHVYAAPTLDDLTDNPTEIGTTSNIELQISIEDIASGVQFFHVRAE